jgi:hypothetical protein
MHFLKNSRKKGRASLAGTSNLKRGQKAGGANQAA